MAYLRLLLLWVFALTLTTPSQAKADPLCRDPIMTGSGAVTGHKDGPTCSWKGIPYAAPPIDDLRWQSPASPAPWPGILQADKFAPRCIQKGVMELVNFDPSRSASEDCLYLNIWRPEGEGPFPVFVWVHGGGFFGGTANTPIYHGQNLANVGNMVVVSLNYRLAIFGFLATQSMVDEDPNGSAGNYGLLDQLAALEWVQGNIESFGGDPTRVTLAGESAGGWSVCSLMASPLSKGLFHQAIMESGGCRAVTELDRAFDVGKRVATDLGCPENDLDCMRSKSAKKVLRRGVKPEIKGFEWLPRIDGYVLKEAPLDTIEKGAHLNVPFLAGGNRDEAGVLASLNPLQYFHSEKRYQTRLSRLFGERAGGELVDVYQLEAYGRPIRAYRQIATDVALFCPSFDGLKSAATNQPQSYLYRFDYDQFHFGKLIGAPHGLELPFVFGNLRALPTGPMFWGPRQVSRGTPLSNSMMAYWSNFVWTGDPNGKDLPHWPSFGETGSVQLLDVTIQSAPVNDDTNQRCDYWHAYYETHPQIVETLGFAKGEHVIED